MRTADDIYINVKRTCLVNRRTINHQPPLAQNNKWLETVAQHNHLLPSGADEK